MSRDYDADSAAQELDSTVAAIVSHAEALQAWRDGHRDGSTVAAIVSHAEALQAWRDGHRDGSTVAHALGVSYSTDRRLRRNLRRAGFLD